MNFSRGHFLWKHHIPLIYAFRTMMGMLKSEDSKNFELTGPSLGFPAAVSPSPEHS